MEKFKILSVIFIVFYSCSYTKEGKTSRSEARIEKITAEQAMVRNAIQIKRYIIKFERIYFSYGGIIDLVPRANYMIIDGDRAIINSAYLGKQFDIKPIAAINVRGRAVDYAVTDNLSKGTYDIKLKVNNGRAASFNVYIRISKNGYCSADVSSLKIEHVTYSGYLVPLSDKSDKTLPEGHMI